MNEKNKKLSSRSYLVYVLGAFVLGCVLFLYEVHLNSAPLLRTTSGLTQNQVHNEAIAPLSLIVVRTEADQERGLGDRASLPADEGMLFVFDKPSDYGIWMKDMQFSIDIISLDANFSVVHVEPDVSPATYPSIFFSPPSTKYIIETNAGYAEKNNIKVGSVLDSARKAV
jgi:uncharacterized membrane protein (UPF0127 family)